MKLNKNGWQVKPLGEVCEIIGGNPAPKGDEAFVTDGLPFVKMKDVGRYHLTNNLIDIENRVSSETAKKNRLKLIKRGSILLPRSGSVALNHRAILGRDAYMVSHLCALEIKDLASVYNRFLYYYLTTINFSNITKKTTGLDALTFEDLARVKIPLPPLPIQKQIAEILEKADAAKQKRKEANKLTDEFLQSVFIEMFGDPVKNSKGLKRKFIGDLCLVTKLAGFEYTKYIKYQDAGEIIVVRGLNVKNCKLKLDHVKYIDRSRSEFLKRSKLFKDDIVMTYIGINIGDVAIVEESDKYHLAPNVAKITTKDSRILNPIYLLKFLDMDYNKNQFRKFTTNTAKQALNMASIRKLEIPLPPISLQQQFAEIVNKTETLKEKQKQSEQELENLFQSLMQKAFKGELVH